MPKVDNDLSAGRAADTHCERRLKPRQVGGSRSGGGRQDPMRQRALRRGNHGKVERTRFVPQSFAAYSRFAFFRRLLVPKYACFDISAE